MGFIARSIRKCSEMRKAEHWEEDFPISRSEEHKISRREFTRFACMGAVACACAVVARGAAHALHAEAGGAQQHTTRHNTLQYDVDELSSMETHLRTFRAQKFC